MTQCQISACLNSGPIPLGPSSYDILSTHPPLAKPHGILAVHSGGEYRNLVFITGRRSVQPLHAPPFSHTQQFMEFVDVQ